MEQGTEALVTRLVVVVRNLSDHAARVIPLGGRLGLQAQPEAVKQSPSLGPNKPDLTHITLSNQAFFTREMQVVLDLGE